MKKYQFHIILVLAALINIIQSFSTELLQDEAYYWMYSNFLDWGYFDHPPLVAIYIYLSDFLFSGELGVRFMSAILYSIMVYLIWSLIDIPNKEKHQNLFLLTIFSTALLNVYGFITVPDTPLLFFMALFLIAYKRIVSIDDWKAYLLFSISIAGLLYSKYTGLLIVIFTILSNLSLLKSKKFWMSVIGVLILYSPHLLWQYFNDYPSFRYHLFERSSSKTYRIDYTMMHLLNQIAIIGFTFPIMYLAFFKNLKNKDLFQKSLNYIIIGFIGFFFIMSFKGPTQAQWTVPISFPLIIITFLYIIDNPKSKKIFKRLAILNLIVICFARIILANEGILPVELETHGNKKWVQDMQKETNGERKLFVNSYQNASLYSFYTNELTGAYNAFNSRKNQYNLWDFQTPLAGENILLINGSKTEDATYIFNKKKKRKLYGIPLNNFKPIRDLAFSYNPSFKLKQGENSLNITILNPYKESRNLRTTETIIVFKNKKNQTINTTTIIYTSELLSLAPQKESICDIRFTVSDKIDLKKIDHFDIVIRNNPKMAYQKVN